MATFYTTSCCEKLKTKCISGNLYDPKEDKDVQIAKLNSKIVKLEQKEKDYDLLSQEFKQLENDYTLLNEAKLRLEYENKQRNDAYNKRISDLRNENDNLQAALSDKNCVNKKLFEEKKCLENQLKMKNDAIDDMNNKIDNSNNRINDLQGNKGDLQNNLRELNDIKDQQRNKIDELIEDNKRLAKICQEQDHSLYLNAQEKQKLGKKINEDNANLSNLNSKLRLNDTNLKNLQNQLDNSNVLNVKLHNNLKDLDNALINFKIDNDNLKNGFCAEHALHEDEAKKNEQLRCVLNDKQNKLRCLNNDYVRMKNSHEMMNQDRNMLKMENEKLKHHIMNLTSQNQGLTNEIENVLKEDEQLKNLLNRSDRMSCVLKTNDTVVSQVPPEMLSVPNCYNDSRTFMCPENKLNLSQSFGRMRRERCYSPQYTYNRSEQII